MSENNISPKITALAITYNEEINVKRYVESLSFADEIIFIDSQSTDKTVEIALEKGVKVIERKFTNFSDQRNYAISQAKNDWIVFFDLDEIITPSLETEIKNIVSNAKGKIAFFVKRNFFFMNKHIHFGGWQNDKAIRIFNKKFCEYNGNLVHESIKARGKIGLLQNKVNHYSYKDFDNYNNKLNLYSKLQSANLYHKKLKPTFYHFLFRPLYRFLWQYLFRLGVLDGKEGFILAYIHSFSVFKRYLQLWMMYRKIE
jgi:glycosyltransferase involved in cell wall biosynthesis